MKIILDNTEEVEIELNREELIYGIEGVFLTEKHDKAYIPLLKKKIPIYAGNKNAFFIPAHNREDWDYAISHNLSINSVVAPYFKGTGNEEIRKDVITQKRKSVIAIIKHDTEDKYLCVDCKNRSCKSFVLGGIEPGEKSEETAVREVKEETGYTDISINYKSPIKLINHFYAGYKGINRYSTLELIFGKLNSEKNIGIADNENAKHVVKWIKKEDLKDFININNNKYALDILLNGDRPYTDDGIMINSGKFNDMMSNVARNIIKKELNNQNLE